MKFDNGSLRSGTTFLDVLTFVVLLAIAAATVFSIYVLLRPDPPAQVRPTFTVPPVTEDRNCLPPPSISPPGRSDVDIPSGQ
jgi:hypothetical protein